MIEFTEQGVLALPVENRISAYRIYVSKELVNTPTMSRLYDYLIKKDSKMCVEKMCGSLTLHYNQGILCKVNYTETAI